MVNEVIRAECQHCHQVSFCKHEDLWIRKRQFSVLMGFISTIWVVINYSEVTVGLSSAWPNGSRTGVTAGDKEAV